MPRTTPRTRLRKRSCAAALGAALAVLAWPLAGPAAAEPPGIPDPATARAELEALTTAEPGSMDGYSREEFPHWSEADGCTTRQRVLARDGSDVQTGDDCQPDSGIWFSPYDGVTLTDDGETDIDHVVPLAEAWRSGAAGWTTEQREAFANDLDHPQLIAVSASSNRSKGDQDPAEWQPAADYLCTYAAMWVRSKYSWGLTVDDAERTALAEMLGTC
ncbi:HNH endonuclease family protein [Streptomyces sp. DSM 44917]|uniref:HNH endonuclease family protein n=1 Tax=Streptomyces boetiae TaxID=3075541 RepID=A0ABU2LDE6_9ACTN|nr:HNH endonuclease family protein [Streptomyces sp. DSM 44917]MDT0309605.1 HNH endonuclease family protein [Streptomyces sp. DSM 44917]